MGGKRGREEIKEGKVEKEGKKEEDGKEEEEGRRKKKRT